MTEQPGPAAATVPPLGADDALQPPGRRIHSLDSDPSAKSSLRPARVGPRSGRHRHLQELGTSGRTDVRRPFNAVLLEDDRQRADAVLALLARLAGAEVRVIRMRAGSPNPHGTLEGILIQAAGPDGEAFSEDKARLIVRAIAKRQGNERGVMLLIEHAEAVHPKMLRALQAMAPYFTQGGEPTLQATFVGRPTFRALLDGPGLASLRDALGGGPTSPAHMPVSPRGHRHDSPVAALKATAGVPGEPTPVSQSAPPAEPAVASAAALRRGRILLRLALVLAAAVIAMGAAYVGLRRVFYRDLPARPAVSAAMPAAPLPGSASSLPGPSTPSPSLSVPSAPAPPVAEMPAPSLAPGVAPPGAATPPIGSAAPLPADPPTRLRQEFEAFLANSGRNVATLSAAQRSALFGEYLEWRSKNAPAPNATPGIRIVIHVPAGSETAEALSARLLASLPPRSSTVEARRVAATPDRPSIRYFYPEDEPAARLTARWMAGTGVNWTLQDLSAFQPLPSRGTIEVWLPRQP